MKNESSTLKEVMDIRVAVYEEIKDLPPDQQTAYFSDAARRMEQEYGIHLRRPAHTPEKRVM